MMGSTPSGEAGGWGMGVWPTTAASAMVVVVVGVGSRGGRLPWEEADDRGAGPSSPPQANATDARALWWRKRAVMMPASRWTEGPSASRPRER